MARCKNTDMLTKAIKKAGGGKVQTSSDTARKLAKEMGGMKKGGAPMPREGVSTRPTGPGGRRITMKDLERSNRDTGGMSAAEIKAAGEAIKRGNREPYEVMPKKKGGVAKKAIGGAMMRPGMADRQRPNMTPVRAVIAPAPERMQQMHRGRMSGPKGVRGEPVVMDLGSKGLKDGGVAKYAKGGAGKVRKGMMSKSGDILQAVKPKKGIGGIM